MDEGTYNTPLEELELPARPYNALMSVGITAIGQVLEWLETSHTAGPPWGFGEGDYDLIIAQLKRKGYLSDDDALGAPSPTK